MIFVTVGAQMSFDRLVRTIDEWAGARGRSDLFAQVGPGGYRPRHFESTEFLRPPEFASRLRDASALVAHAGMGSILMALEAGKPIVVMPRRGSLRETRNDHQVATASRLRELHLVEVAMDETELPDRLDQIGRIEAAARIKSRASAELIARIARFVHGVPRGDNEKADGTTPSA